MRRLILEPGDLSLMGPHKSMRRICVDVVLLLQGSMSI